MVISKTFNGLFLGLDPAAKGILRICVKRKRKKNFLRYFIGD
jgi:hypothetical protein